MWDTLQPLSRRVVELYVKVNRTISMHLYALALQAPSPTKKGDIESLKNQFHLPGLIQQKPRNRTGNTALWSLLYWSLLNPTLSGPSPGNTLQWETLPRLMPWTT